MIDLMKLYPPEIYVEISSFLEKIHGPAYIEIGLLEYYMGLITATIFRPGEFIDVIEIMIAYGLVANAPGYKRYYQTPRYHCLFLTQMGREYLKENK